MKQYETLELEVMVFSSEDVIITSGKPGDISLPPTWFEDEADQ
jgi:hypothetical protein